MNFKQLNYEKSVSLTPISWKMKPRSAGWNYLTKMWQRCNGGKFEIIRNLALFFKSKWRGKVWVLIWVTIFVLRSVPWWQVERWREREAAGSSWDLLWCPPAWEACGATVTASDLSFQRISINKWLINDYCVT